VALLPLDEAEMEPTDEVHPLLEKMEHGKPPLKLHEEFLVIIASFCV
jgi:hypothetical protein